MESQIENPESKEWQLGVLKNIEQNIPKTHRKEMQNWVIVKNYLTGHTNKGGRTSACIHCEWLGIDPDGYTFYEK